MSEEVAALADHVPDSAAERALQLLGTRDGGLVGQLQALRNPDGSYGESEGERLTTTGLALLAQTLVGSSDSAAASYLEGRQNSDGSWGDGGSADETGLVLSALLSAGQDGAVTENAVAWLVRHQSPTGGWGTVAGSAWALLALDHDDSQPAAQELAARSLMALQLPDGGFPRRETGSSQVSTTGLVTWALLEAEADFDGLEAALAFLTTQKNGSTTQNDSGWYRTGRAVIDTTAALDTFHALAQADSTTALAVLWILQRETPSSDFLARRLGSLARFGTGIETELASLLALQNDDGGWGAAAGYESTVLDTVIALDAIIGADHFDPALLNRITQFLTTTQLPDGSWGLTTDDTTGTIWATALAMQTLKQYRRVFDLETAIGDGRAYLESRQLGDGGWGEGGTGRVWESALAFLACMQTQFSTTAAENGLAYLLDSQDGDGSWNQDPYDTALAIRALAASQPNLFISDRDIAFSTPGGVEGDNVTITATVTNTGGFGIDSAVIAFFLGDPHAGGVQIGTEQVITSLGPGVSAPVALPWDTTGLGGDKHVFVLLDPAGVVEEANENDNKAVNRFRVSSRPDLIIAGITYLPENPQAFEETSFTVLLSNIGETAAENVIVDFTREAMKLPGQIHSTEIGPVLVPAGAVVPRTVNTNMNNDEFHFTAIADPDNLVQESNETNNQTAITLEVGERIDLQVAAVHFSKPDPSEGEVLEIWADIYNANVDSVSAVEVVFCLDGTPGYGLELGRLNIPFIAGGGTVSTRDLLTVTWETMGYPGDHVVYVEADPSDDIIETDELNNSQVARFLVNALPDLVMGNDIIRFHPNSTESDAVTTVPRGTPLVLVAPLSNAGAQSADNVTFRFYLGDPRSGGVQIGEDQLAETIPYMTGPMSGAVSVNDSHFATVLVGSLETDELDLGTYPIFGWIDPDNQVLEPDDVNNLGFTQLEIGTEADLEATLLETSDSYPEEGDIVTISGTITNLQPTPAGEHTIRVYDGNPLAEGVEVFSTTFSSIAGAGTTFPDSDTNSFELEWSTDLELGLHTFYLLVDPDDEIVEYDESNNESTMQLEVVPASAPDLAITAADVVFDPAKVPAGQPVTITSTVSNLRRMAADNVVVRVLRVDPVEGEVQVGSDQVIAHIAERGQADAAVTLDTSALIGSSLIIVRVDPDNLINERIETNNVATTVLRLFLPDGAQPSNLQATVDLTDVYLNWQEPASPGVSIDGYAVERDGDLINPDLQEWARQSSASASSHTTTHSAELGDFVNNAAAAIDGNPITFWESEATSDATWISVQLPRHVLLAAVTVLWRTPPRDYRIEIWNGFTWVPVLDIAGNEDRTTYHLLEHPIETDRVRIYAPARTTGNNRMSITELKVQALRPVQ
jgi:subtilase family serine protease/prenyltransferase beta subunit